MLAACGGSADGAGGGAETDNCGGGANMTDPTLGSAFDPDGVPADLLIEWAEGTGRGAELPPDYFEQVFIAPSAEPLVVESIQEASVVAQRQIRVRFDDLSELRATQNGMSFSLGFPDRRDYIDCSHPGMADQHLLDIDIDWSGTPVTVEMTERVVLGPI